MKVKRMLAAMAALIMTAGGGLAASYTQNSDGLYVDSSGKIITELWDDAAGLYISDGVGYAIRNTDTNPDYSDPGSGRGASTNSDGSITVESGTYGTPDASESSSGGQHLTEEEWAARLAKYSAKLGTTTGTSYIDENGDAWPAEVVYMGLGRSIVLLDGTEAIVPTASLKWDCEVPDEKRLAVVYPKSQSYATLRAKSTAKAFVMGHANKCMVVRVIRSGKTWSLVDLNGARGYVYTSALQFYDNNPKLYVTGTITINGKTPKGSDFTVHVRDATSKGRQIAEFSPGTPITVFSRDDKLCEVDVEGYHCYIQAQFVTLDTPDI